MVILISRNFWWKNKYLFLEIFNNYLGIIRFIRAILQYVENKLKAYNNDLTRCLFCVCKCCLWCLEKFMRFINRNAYIMCAIKSTNFCVSAKDAFSLLMRNIVRVLVLNNVWVWVLLFICKLMLSSDRSGTRNLSTIGFLNCHGQMGLKQIEQVFFSFLTKYLL